MTHVTTHVAHTTRALLAPLALALLLGGCKDALVEEPESFLTTESFYKTQADLESAVLASYNQLRAAYNGSGGAWWAAELASDQGRIDVGEPSIATSGPDFLFYDASGGNGVQAIWTPMYAMIYRANLAIANAPNIEATEAAKAQLVGEAKFMRAYGYLQLTKRYDDVPLLLTPADHETTDAVRAPVADVHTQMVTDLTEAEAALPATWTGANAGRATKGAAGMALADLYLWRASFLKSGEWQQASTWAKKVIDSGIYALSDDYIATFLPSNKGNREMIFRVVSSGVDARSSSAFGQTYYPRVLGFNAGGGFGIVHPTDWFYDSYAAGDYRKEAGYRTTGCSTTTTIGCQTFEPMPWKYRPTNNTLTLGNVDVPLYRYAEALLFYAEAQNELGNTGEAIRNVNIVRARARRGTGAESRAQPANLLPGVGQLAARDAIYMERNWELAFEAKRWFDLVRRDGIEPGFWQASLLAHDPNASKLQAIAGYKKRWPIPQSEIDVAPGLTQNPGY